MRKTKSNRINKKRSQRQLRAGELLRHALADILSRGEFYDPILIGRSLTVAEVRVSPDLRNANAFVMPRGGKNAKEVIAALNRAAPFLRRQLGSQVSMRHLPTISFELDVIFDQGQRIQELLKAENDQREARPAGIEP